MASRSPSSGTASTATISGTIDPRVAATPPGRCSAAKNSIGKKTPMLRTPSTALFHHQSPCGRARPIATASSPAGSARIRPANSGCPGGSSSVVTA
ncbi:Uncharacterised protein [Mycobacteroides abscessus subsp. abscessus]|nr:Uncharacterised protein [Mycobacteroides abscessus subsp. abscessus]